MSEMMWHYAHSGATHGPLLHADLCSLFASKELPLETQVWNEGLSEWVAASSIDDFRDIWGKGFACPPVAPAPSDIPLAPSPVTMRPSMGLRTNQRTPEEGADNGPQVRPWIRYWARGVDTSLLIAAAVYLFSTAWPEGLVYFPYIVVGSMILHPIQLSMFGTTFGKALFGISVRTEQGDPPSLGQAASREFGVLLRGMGLNLFVLPLITMIVGYRRLKAEGVTSWDQDNGIIVRHKRVGIFRWVIWLLVVHALTLYVIVHSPGVAEVMKVVEAVRAGQFINRPQPAAASPGVIHITATSQPTTRPAGAKKPRPRPKLLTLPSEKATSKPPIKSNSPATRPLNRQDRPAPRVIYKPEPPPES